MTQILIIDDDPQIRDVLRIALKQAGYDVAEAGDGAEGLAKARRGKADLIVLDIGLPEMDGLELCRSLRAEQETPILFLTARDDEIDRVLGLELGGDDYVTKPFSPRELIARIRAILKRSSPGGERCGTGAGPRRPQAGPRSASVHRGGAIGDPDQPRDGPTQPPDGAPRSRCHQGTADGCGLWPVDPCLGPDAGQPPAQSARQAGRGRL